MKESNMQDPTARIAAMRKIGSSSGGFARLYGAKDLEQFSAQVEFMRDFTCHEATRDIPFSDPMPTYADMSTAQLRCYFAWRTRVWQGYWEDTQYSYALVYLFELLSAPGNAERLAEAWLRLRECHPKLDQRMTIWFKDYCLCFDLDFWAQVHSLNLGEFYPGQGNDSLADTASYNCRNSRFFRERPALLPLLETSVDAALRNLEPLFAFYNLSPGETFFPQPVRFSHYQPFKDAAVLPPENHPNKPAGLPGTPEPGAREVRLSRNEVYRLRGGRWSAAADGAFRPPSHAAGWLVKRTEATLRDCAGFTAPWNDREAVDLKERWLHHEVSNSRMFELLEDPRLPELIAETVRAVYGNSLPPDGLVPQASRLARAMEEEPFRSIRKIQGAATFRRQGELLAALEDDYDGHAPCQLLNPSYAALKLNEMRTYLTWRSRLRNGDVRRTDSAYAMLYMRELAEGIGTDDALGDLCRLLRAYGPLDKMAARRLPELIMQRAPAPAQLLALKVEPWFPALFLFGQGDQFAIFRQLSGYKIARSRFYREGQHQLFQDCFTQCLAASRRAFEGEGFDLRRLMLDVGGPTAFASAFASFLLKRMEQRLRELARFPYHITADPAQMMGAAAQQRGNAPRNRKKLHAFVCSRALSGAIDQAVEESGVRIQVSVEARGRRQAAPPPEPPSPPKPVHVTVDFTQLDRIRDEAREMTELLIVEDDEMQNAECRNAELM